ncbi:isocitrate lyase/phosphoenolpyruvate mutase family protein [Actinokineospora sp. NBRC 105648]|uniref:isocitrate lyase/PEP mutase family protein n=1 Tax=Actinokineospora sp. NBRC 105648 TaxID=3032206 RepID=UPI0024A2E624|nr:isocitrate lyase/phosphoenolpyruvate mutase family protein [Actinokineospora sp. NBRC 105648]GLZ38373.1 hypothetical carboxyvinyl-carboxyphosphonate phosphorylmutase [Actinokineospora sp. NBRC 105648]
MHLDAADQAQRARAFAELHQGPSAFVIANPWDAGTARVLTGLGFRALATTSGGLAFSLGRPDGANLVTRDDTLANARAIVAATHLPVAADLENGFGDRPEDVAETIRLAAEAGLVGGSIEDATGRPDDPVYDLDLAVERVAAAVEAARAMPFPFTLTARAENFLHGRPDLDDTLRRLRAYEQAGADVLYAPGLPDVETIRAVCAAVDKPVNVLATGAAAKCSVTKLGELGARRVSLGSALPRAALTAAVLAAQEIAESGTFTLTTGALTTAQVHGLMAP